MLARRASWNGQLHVIKRTFKKSIRLTVVTILLFLVIFVFIGPKMGHEVHKKYKEIKNHDKEHEEFKKFMKGQEEFQKFMMNNPPPMIDEFGMISLNA